MRFLDPMAVVIGGAGAGAAILAGVSAPAALAIGIAALAIADVGRLRSELLAPRPVRPDLPKHVGGTDTERRPPLHPDDSAWVRRADDAVSAIRRSIGVIEAGPLRDRLREVAAEAGRVLEEVRLVAAQVSATRVASEQLDVPQLSMDLDRLTATLRQNGEPELVRDLERSTEAVREQLRVGRRLAEARRALQARVEAGVLGLQQLAAQVSEMAALTPPGGGAWQHGERIDQLATQLETLREGLSDVDEMSRRVLGTVDTEGGTDVPVVP